MRALLLALTLPPMLELISFSRIASWLTRAPGPRDQRLDDRELSLWVDEILNGLPWRWKNTCLRRASVLYPLLRRAGRPVELWIGVRRESPGTDLTAHAWLTLDNTPYLEPNPAHPGRHTPIARFPEALRAG